jgi:hypothetical protein
MDFNPDAQPAASICFEPLGFLANFRNMARVPPVIRASGDAAIFTCDGSDPPAEESEAEL